MSKAFTRESDDLPERAELKRPATVLPPGVKNYFTPAGVDALRRELEGLEAQSDSASVRQRIFEIQHLQSAVMTAPPLPPWDQVFFGATVAVRDQRGEVNTYRIVGVDETDIDRDWISWLSPLAKALLKARVGGRVHFHAPAGEQMLEIISVRYD